MNRKPGTKTILIAAAVVVVLAVAVYALAAAGKSGSINSMNATVKDVSLKFLQALKSGNIDEARTYLSVEGQKAYDADKLKQITVPELTMTGEPEASGNDATIVHGNKEQNKYIKLTLIKENNNWKVSQILAYTLAY